MTATQLNKTLALEVVDVKLLNPLIRAYHLRSPVAELLPGYEAGAHIKLEVELADGAKDWRHYSLVNLDATHRTDGTVPEYLVAVRREDIGRGGSKWLHENVKIGTILNAEVPRNDFPMHESTGKVVLLAGGIGVTPLISMAANCRAKGHPVLMIYAGRSRSGMAFIEQIRSMLGDDLHLHVDDERGGPVDIKAVLDQCNVHDSLHVCGPTVLLDAVLAEAKKRGWEQSRVHFELFAPPQQSSSNKEFEIVLSSSSRRLTVRPHESILDVLIAAGYDPMFDCKRGECGVCAVGVISGEIDHRDYVLTQGERDAGNVIHTCVSRCAGSTLVLDL